MTVAGVSLQGHGDPEAAGEALPGDACAQALLVGSTAARPQLQEALAPLCLALVCVPGGREALPLLAQREFAFALLDVSRPGAGGFEAAALIRSQPGCERLPLVFLGGGDADDPVRAAAVPGPVDCLVLPVSREILRSRAAILLELYEQGRELRALRRSHDEGRARLAAIVEASDDAIVSKTLDGVITSWNEGAVRVFGYEAAEMIGRSILRVIPPELHEEETQILDRLRRGERIEHFETDRVRKDGQRIRISLTVSPVRDASGRIIGASKIARDVSERRRAEQHRELLIHELNHRAKNMLTLVQSLASQTRRSVSSPEHFHDAYAQRLAALARVYDTLTREGWTGVSLAQIARESVVSRPVQGAGARVSLEGPDVRLEANAAVTLSMVLHELYVNAVKYGALSGEAGGVRLSWTTPAEGGRRGQVQLCWVERGGPPVALVSRTGFGSRLIRQAMRELDGEHEMRFEPAGLEVALRWRMPER